MTATNLLRDMVAFAATALILAIISPTMAFAAAAGAQPPPPGPPPPPPPFKPAFNCSVTAARPDCNCSGVHPPFAASEGAAPLLDDFHYPDSEPAQAAALAVPQLLAAFPANGSGAQFNCFISRPKF